MPLAVILGPSVIASSANPQDWLGEAIQVPPRPRFPTLDCFAALAMTVLDRSSIKTVRMTPLPRHKPEVALALQAPPTIVIQNTMTG